MTEPRIIYKPKNLNRREEFKRLKQLGFRPRERQTKESPH